MKRPKMNQWERLMYRKETTRGLHKYMYIQFGKLFREMGFYRMQAKIKELLGNIGVDIVFKSELSANPIGFYERQTLKELE